jgi:hypothetical protein
MQSLIDYDLEKMGLAHLIYGVVSFGTLFDAKLANMTVDFQDDICPQHVTMNKVKTLLFFGPIRHNKNNRNKN